MTEGRARLARGAPPPGARRWAILSPISLRPPRSRTEPSANRISSRAPSRNLAHKPVRAIYESRDPIRLIVVDKVNGVAANQVVKITEGKPQDVVRWPEVIAAYLGVKYKELLK